MITDKCIGCKLCEKVCPRQAIKMNSKWFGFSYPEINNELCIHCGLCDKVCPTNNIVPTNVKECYVGYSKKDIRKKCSSGGIFPEIANYVLLQKGVVFGAIFDKDWNVIIAHTETDITPMLGSKYVQADVKDTYKECKEFLDQGRMVLYTGTPCQIYGLKGFLKHDYDNLITVDIFCHGVPSPKAWHNYLKSFNKEIESINFRDKRTSWEQYSLSIKFKDGTELLEYHRDNKYMQLFLDDKILRKSCYDCQLRYNSKADISIGDAWGIQTKLNDHRGLSDIVVHTTKGKLVLDSLDLVKELISYNNVLKTNCIKLKLNIPIERTFYNKLLTDTKIGIITDQVRQNVGGILQAVALANKVKEITGIEPIFLNQIGNNYHQKYFDNNCKWTTSSVTNETHLIVGSDQVWNRRFCRNVPFNDKYLIHDNIKKIVYAASFGHHQMEYTREELEKIHNSLSKVKFIATREISGTMLTKQWFNVDSISVLDPTMLYDKDFYLKTINQKNNTNEHGIFAYILDYNNNWRNICNSLSNQLNEPILKFNGSCEQFIENYNTAKYIITDSYHGSVFSLIFNKPFICLRNKFRGNDRFDDLCIRFDIDSRFIENLNEMDLSLLNKNPDCLKQIREYRKDSLNFLTKALLSL